MDRKIKIDKFLNRKEPKFDLENSLQRAHDLDELRDICREEILYLRDISEGEENETLDQFEEFVHDQLCAYCSCPKHSHERECENGAYGLLTKACRHQYPELLKLVKK